MHPALYEDKWCFNAFNSMYFKNHIHIIYAQYLRIDFHFRTIPYSFHHALSSIIIIFLRF